MTKGLCSHLQNLPLVLAGYIEFLQLLAFQRSFSVFEAVKNVLNLILLCSDNLFVFICLHFSPCMNVFLQLCHEICFFSPHQLFNRPLLHLQMKPSKCFKGRFIFLLTKSPLIAPAKYFLASLHPNKVAFISICVVITCNFIAVPDACIL